MKIKHYSLTKSLRRIYIALTLFLLAILMIYNHYCLETVRNQYTQTQRQAMNIYTHEVDISLSKISSLLMSFMLQNTMPSLNGLTPDELYYAKSEITGQLSTSLLFLDYCEGLFLYDAAADEFCYAFSGDNALTNSYSARMNIPQAAREIMASENAFTRADWYITTLEDQPFLLYLLWEDQVCMGSWIYAGHLLPQAEAAAFSSEISLTLADLTGTPVAATATSLTGTPAAATAADTTAAGIRLSQAFDTIPLTLELSAPSSAYWATMSDGLKLLLAAGIIALLAIPAAYFLLARIVRRPLEQVLYSISRYEAADSSYIPKDQGMPDEIIQINHALLRMYQEIRALKIDIYEQKLNLKEIHLQYLQHQIKPHFVINILNTVSLMAQMNDNNHIISVIHYLSNYMRNMLNTHIRSNTLRAETEALDNYLELQKIRYPEQITVDCHIEPELEDFEIPVLTLQTLVENVFKHAMESYEPLTITIRAAREGSCVTLSVSDNGRGFPESFMESFNDHPEDPGDGHHIGLVNIRQRLNLEYPEQASIRLSNGPGAVVTIRLPWPSALHSADGHALDKVFLEEGV